MVVLPVPKDSATVKSERMSRRVDFVSMPSVIVKPVKMETKATTGMVRPILANAEPKARFKLI